MPVKTAILPPGMHSALMVGVLTRMTSHFHSLARAFHLWVCGNRSSAMRRTRLACGSSGGGSKRIAAHRLAAQLAVLLPRRLLELRGRDQVAHQRGAADLDAPVIVLGPLRRRRHAGHEMARPPTGGSGNDPAAHASLPPPISRLPRHDAPLPPALL